MARLVAWLSRFSGLSLRTRERSSKARSCYFLQCLSAFLLISFVAGNAQLGQAPGIQPFSTRNFNIDLASSSITALFTIRSKAGKVPVWYSLATNYQIESAQNGVYLTYNLSSGPIVGQLNAHTVGYAVKYTDPKPLTTVLCC